MRRAAITDVLQVIPLLPPHGRPPGRNPGTRPICAGGAGWRGEISATPPRLSVSNRYTHPSVFRGGLEPRPHAEAEQEAGRGPSQVGGVVDARDRKPEEDVD